MTAGPQLKPYRQFAYARSADQDARVSTRHRVIIVGAGPIGLALAIDLAQRGVSSVVLDDSDRIGDGSRAICFSKKTLEIFDRLGVAMPALAKGVQWQVGKVFRGDELLYRFDLLPERGHKMPAFINLQQYYAEDYLIERAQRCGGVELRWRNKVVGVAQDGAGVTVSIDTPDGPYRLSADWLIACDGARSPVRGMLGLDFRGEMFEDQFLIADVKMTAAFPTERWFWFDPPFHPGQSALLHKQPDDVWRIDLQLPRDADTEHERQPHIVRPRIERMLGHGDFELEWVSIYRFQCRRLDRFVHDRVIFAGDSAHQVSPFGARGANSGIQDAENLAWKLARVIAGSSPRALLDTYDVERLAAADENIGHSTRSTDFIAPHGPAEKTLRDAALDLARSTEFAKRMVNPGRLSTATAYRDSPLSTPDAEMWAAGPPPGAPIIDAPLQDRSGRDGFLSEALGNDFTLLHGADVALPPRDGITTIGVGASGGHRDAEGLIASRYDLTPGAAYLIRPDGHVAARFRTVATGRLDAALARATGLLT
ncbi:MAG: FAD-dependent oxidoreductase [Hyphomicrobiales bacterium]|nr:FAD-dependent oxidoreductase [Hyphomicrobiales bacterium]